MNLTKITKLTKQDKFRTNEFNYKDPSQLHRELGRLQFGNKYES